jgi:hypothetical protein
MRRAILIPLLAALALAAAAVPAQAALQVEGFETLSSSSAAGAHPDLRTKFRLNGAGAEVAKNITFDAPQGMYGNPSSLGKCSPLDAALVQCPPLAQAGVITVHANYLGDPNYLLGTAPIYNVDTAGDEAARFTFNVPTLNIPIAILVGVRSATDYGLRFTVSGITQTAPLSEVDMTFWGFPASNAHNSERFPTGSISEPAGCPGLADTGCNAATPERSPLPAAPFTGNPSVCGRPMPTNLYVETYQRPGVLEHGEASYPLTTECERQTFKPFAQARLTTKATDSPSGMELEFNIPQSQNKAAAPSQLKAAKLVLPPGLTVNPDAADGQTACSDADAKLHQETVSQCPDSSKVGNFIIESESLPGPLTGSLYFGEPVPGNQYRVYMFADGFGIHVKLIGKLLPDPQTGRLTTEFTELPQLPFEKFKMSLFASDRGVFATPINCSVHTIDTDLSPWNPTSPDQNSLFGLDIGEGPNGTPCPGQVRPFDPRLNAGTSNSKAGGFSSFTLRLDREDGDQYLGDLNFTMPPGLTGSLRGITYCPEAAIAAAETRSGRAELAAPSCPPSSQIGTTNVAAGPGSHPFHALGRMYLAGPLNGAPLSLVAITPALAGPFDYGVVVVRVGIRVGSADAHVIALSEKIPSIIGGIPLRMRSIQVNLDRPNFIINPTNCQPMSVLSQGVGDQGTVADFSSYLQAVDCAELPFKPRMTVRAIGKATKRSQNPRLRFDLRTRPGDANLKSLSLTLPQAFSIDQRHLGNICAETELAQDDCAGRTPIGIATDTTPLLDQPLRGLVYAVSGHGGLPRLAFILNGQVSLVPRAESVGTRKGLKTTVPVIPDAPMGHFRLDIFGGKHGYLVNTHALCGHRAPVAKVMYFGQNGKQLNQNAKIRIPCGAGKKHGKHSGRGRSGHRGA